MRLNMCATNTEKVNSRKSSNEWIFIMCEGLLKDGQIVSMLIKQEEQEEILNLHLS